jgi:hypothetical protein
MDQNDFSASLHGCNLLEQRSGPTYRSDCRVDLLFSDKLLEEEGPPKLFFASLNTFGNNILLGDRQ